MSESTSLPSLAGIIPFSATDWPGQLTITAFTQGCPLACRYCHNPSLQPIVPAQPFSDVLNLLEKRRGLIDALVISGGEPIIHPGLGAAIAMAHDLGFPVGLHTSGYRPSAIAALLATPETTPDWVGLDVKALPMECQELFGMSARSARGCWESLDLLTHAEVETQVRTTVWPRLAEKLPALAGRVASFGHVLVVQQARGVDGDGWFCA